MMAVVMMTITDLELLGCHFKYAMIDKKRLNDWQWISACHLAVTDVTVTMSATDNSDHEYDITVTVCDCDCDYDYVWLDLMTLYLL